MEMLTSTIPLLQKEPLVSVGVMLFILIIFFIYAVKNGFFSKKSIDEDNNENNMANNILNDIKNNVEDIKRMSIKNAEKVDKMELIINDLKNNFNELDKDVVDFKINQESFKNILNKILEIIEKGKVCLMKNRKKEGK